MQVDCLGMLLEGNLMSADMAFLTTEGIRSRATVAVANLVKIGPGRR